MSDFTDIRPKDLRMSLCRNGVWHQDSFTHIVTNMFYDRPSRWLFEDMFTSREMVHRYTELVDMACKYADDMAYPWIKTKLKDIVWVDFKGFYDTLAQLIASNIKEMPFSPFDEELVNTLAAIWVKVGTFSDDHDITPSATNTDEMQVPKQPFRIPSTVTILK